MNDKRPIGDPDDGQPVDYRNAAVVLRKAVDLIDECGWVQKTYGDPAVGFCVRGAVFHIIRKGMRHDLDEYMTQWASPISNLRVTLSTTRRMFVQVNGAPMVLTNDQPEMTWADMKTKMLDTARACEDRADG